MQILPFRIFMPFSEVGLTLNGIQGQGSQVIYMKVSFAIGHLSGCYRALKTLHRMAFQIFEVITFKMERPPTAVKALSELKYTILDLMDLWPTEFFPNASNLLKFQTIESMPENTQ